MTIASRLPQEVTRYVDLAIAEVLRRLPRFPDFARLARFDKPIGIYLLLWPTMWGLWLAAEGWPGLHLFVVFVLGVVITRAAGCIINDVADREFDGEVKRTELRPLPQGLVSVQEAIIFCAALCLVALLLVLTTNALTIWLSFAAVLIAGAYPFMKRYTYLPQVVLGVAFSWGIPMAFAAVQGEVPRLAWLLLTANLLWTVAYDTEYAMVDRDDDLELGLKSTAILFGDLDRLMIAILQTMFIAAMLLIRGLAHLGSWYLFGLWIAVALLLYQHYLIRNRERDGCFKAFLGNHWVGLTIFAGIAADFIAR